MSNLNPGLISVLLAQQDIQLPKGFVEDDHGVRGRVA